MPDVEGAAVEAIGTAEPPPDEDGIEGVTDVLRERFERHEETRREDE